MKTTSPRQQKSLETKRKIYDVFCRLSVKYNGEFTVKDICEEAGVSVGSFYHYFDSKESVTHYLYEYQDAEMLAYDYPKEPRARILAVCDRFMSFSVDKGIAFMKMASIYETSHRPTIATGQYSGQIFHSGTSKILVSALDEGVSQNIFHLKEPSWYYADMIIFICRSQLHFWMVNDGNYDLRENTRKYISTFIRQLCS